MGAQELGCVGQIDIEPEDADWRPLELIDSLLSLSRQRWSLRLELTDLAYTERHHQENQACQRQDYAHEDDSNRGHPGDAQLGQAMNPGLDQKGDCGAEDEGAEHIADQPEHDHSHEDRGEPEDDLQIQSPAPRIEGPGKRRRRDQGCRLGVFTLVLRLGRTRRAQGTVEYERGSRRQAWVSGGLGGPLLGPVPRPRSGPPPRTPCRAGGW